MWPCSKKKQSGLKCGKKKQKHTTTSIMLETVVLHDWNRSAELNKCLQRDRIPFAVRDCFKCENTKSQRCEMTEWWQWGESSSERIWITLLFKQRGETEVTHTLYPTKVKCVATLAKHFLPNLYKSLKNAKVTLYWKELNWQDCTPLRWKFWNIYAPRVTNPHAPSKPTFSTLSSHSKWLL